MNYESSYNKFWPNKELWEIAFLDALPNRDKTRLKWAVEQQNKELPERTGPVTVDVDAIFCKPTFRSVDQLFARDPAPITNLNEDLAFLHHLAERRDQPNEAIRDLPPAYWKAAYWLKDVEQEFVKEDYLKTPEAIERLHKQGLPDVATVTSKTTEKLGNASLRAWAEDVHNDSPFQQWQTVASDLLSKGYKARCEAGLVDTCSNANHRFGSGGIVSINGLYGEALRRLAPVSFADKWTKMRARPEQLAYSNGKILSQVFREGSPPHPSDRAMHENAAQTLAYVTAIIFDSCELFMGRPLYEELQLESDNISYARCSAGVHYQSDNKYKNSARLMAEELCTEVFGEKCTVPRKMLEVDFSTS